MTEFSEKTGNVTAPDGLDLFYRQVPAENERARLVIAHGLGEHSGRYGNIIQRLVPRGFSIWIPDHRGHGKSGGRRGHVLRFEQYLADLRIMVAATREGLAGERRTFLLGHSLGGLMALFFALRFPELIDGVVASSPGLGMIIEVPPAKKILGSVMSFLWPPLSMGNELDASKISHDPAVVRAYEDDPLVHNRISARWFTEFMRAMKTVNQQASRLSVPTLIQAAGDDQLVSVQATKSFFEKLTLADRTLFVYDGLYHEIYNAPEVQRQKVLEDLENWLEAHLQR